MTPSTIKVRQRKHAIAEASMSTTTLETKDICTCTGLIGLHRDGRVAFMAHLDGLSSVLKLRELADELKASGHEFHEFKLFKVAGAAPAWTYIGFIAAVAPVLIWPDHMGTLLIPCLLAATVWHMSGLTRAFLAVQLWHLGASSAWPRFHGSLGFMNLFGRRDVKFDLKTDGTPRVTKSKGPRDAEFDVE